jgi:hypothetical protein
LAISTAASRSKQVLWYLSAKSPAECQIPVFAALMRIFAA